MHNWSPYFAPYSLTRKVENWSCTLLIEPCAQLFGDRLSHVLVILLAIIQSLTTFKLALPLLM